MTDWRPCATIFGIVSILPGMNIDNVDLVMLSKVVHIGSLNASDKGARGDSYEGSGLSFSVHPEAWEMIAKLGGQPWWEADLGHLKILDGHTFVERHRQALEQWGVDEGLVERGEGYRVSWEDEEMGFVSMLVDTEQEAQNECYERDDMSVEGIPVLRPTLQLLEAMRHSPQRANKACLQVEQDLATVWAQRHGLHGVWWEDRLDPIQYSAPRGVIFAQCVDMVHFQPTQPAAKRRSFHRG